MQQPQPLGSEFGSEPAHPGDVTARPIDTSDEAAFDRVVAAREDDRDVLVASMATSAELLPPVAAVTTT